MSTWSQRVKDLEVAGWSLARIGRTIELSPQSVGDLKFERTTEPRGMSAVKLHDLHKRICCKPRREAAGNG